MKYSQDELYIIVDFLEQQKELHAELFDQDDDFENEAVLYQESIKVIKSLIKE